MIAVPLLLIAFFMSSCQSTSPPSPRPPVYEPIAVLSQLPSRVSASVIEATHNPPRPEWTWLTRALPDLLTTDLTTGGVEVVERSRLEALRQELAVQHGGIVADDSVARIGRMVGATVVIAPSLTILGTSLRLDARIIDVEQGTVLGGTSVQGTADQVLAMERVLALKLIPMLGGKLTQREALTVLIPTTIPSSQSQAVEELQGQDRRRIEAALQRYQEAVRGWGPLTSNVNFPMLAEQTLIGPMLASEAMTQLAVKRSEREVVDELMGWLVRHGYKVTHGKPEVKTDLKDPNRATVTISIAVSLTPEARNRLLAVAKQLGGDADTLEGSWWRAPSNCGFPTDRLPPITRPLVISRNQESQQRLEELTRAQVLTLYVMKANGTTMEILTKRATDHNLESRECTTAQQKPAVYRLLTPQSYGASRGVTRPNWNWLVFPLYPNFHGAPARFHPHVLVADDPIAFQVSFILPLDSVSALQGIKWRVVLEEELTKSR